MASLNNAAFQTNATSDGEDNGSRELLRSGDCFSTHRVLERCYVAAMLFTVNIIYFFRLINVGTSIGYSITHDHFLSPMTNNWLVGGFHTYEYVEEYGKIAIQLPAALLIYLSSHKFLTGAVTISSILHMLMPVTVNAHPSIPTILLCAHVLIAAPLVVTVLAIWRDWAPPGGRAKYVFLSYLSLLLGPPISLLIDLKLQITAGSFYVSGVCGLAWSLLWFFTVPSTPSPNLQRPDNDQLCLQNNTFSTDKEKPKMLNVPLKSILTSKPVFALCLVYFKIGGSSVISVSMLMPIAYQLHLSGNIHGVSFFITFPVIFGFILLYIGLITYFLILKHPTTIYARKIIICKALIIHGILLLGTLLPNIIVQFISFCLSYAALIVALAGFLTNALNLSSQYVSIIGGIIHTFLLLGELASKHYFESISKYLQDLEDKNPFGKILLYEVAVSTFVGGIFLMWGSLEEQLWPPTTASRPEPVNTEVHEMADDQELKPVSCNTEDILPEFRAMMT